MSLIINWNIHRYLLATEIQNIQIGDGDIPHHIPIPIYMVFPRLFTCPTLITTNFKIGKLTKKIVIFTNFYRNLFIIYTIYLITNIFGTLLQTYTYKCKNTDILFNI